MVPETGPFIQTQTFPHPPTGFPQPQAFPQPITVTTLPHRIPPFLPERPVQLGPLPERRPSEGGSVFIPPDMSPASRRSTGSLVQHIQCHPPHFLDHTLQSLEEKFFTSPLALLVQVIPVQIHIGRMVLYVTPEWLTLE